MRSWLWSPSRNPRACARASVALGALFPLLLTSAPGAFASGSRGIDIAADPRGRIYVLVETYAGGSGSAYSLRRYGTSGQLDWSVPLPPGTDGKALASAPDGTLVVAGRVSDGDVADMWLASYSAGGSRLWRRVVDRDYKDRVRDVAVAPDGSIYLVGEPWICKFSRSGTLLWERVWRAGIAAAAAAPDGGLVVAGAGLRRYAPDGKGLWIRRLPRGVGEIESLAVAADGSLYAAGTLDKGSFAYDAQLVKFRPDGTLAWKRNHDGPAGGPDFGHGVAVASDGVVYVAGSVVEISSGTSDIWTAAFRPSGTRLWNATLDGPENGADEGLAVTTVPGGAAFAGVMAPRSGGRWSLWVGRFQLLAGGQRRSRENAVRGARSAAPSGPGSPEPVAGPDGWSR